MRKSPSVKKEKRDLRSCTGYNACSRSFIFFTPIRLFILYPRSTTSLLYCPSAFLCVTFSLSPAAFDSSQLNFFLPLLPPPFCALISSRCRSQRRAPAVSAASFCRVFAQRHRGAQSWSGRRRWSYEDDINRRSARLLPVLGCCLARILSSPTPPFRGFFFPSCRAPRVNDSN